MSTINKNNEPTNKFKLKFNKNFKQFLTNDRYRYQAYLFLNRPNHLMGIIYQMSITFLVFMCIIFNLIPDYLTLFWIDLLMTVMFIVEFIIQVWASTCLARFRGSFLKILFDPICLLDLLIIVTTAIGLITDHNEISIISVVFRGFRIIQFFEHKYRLWRLIGSVIWIGRFQLLLCVYFALILLISISFSLHLIEKHLNDGFKSLGRSIWFTLITLTTVGYGDTVPETTAGKIVTAMALVLGASVFSLPAGIIGAGLALKVEKEETMRSSLQENHAASLIQNMWRVYSIRRMYKQISLLKTNNNFRRNSTNSSPSLSTIINVHNHGHFSRKRHRNLLATEFVYKLLYHLSLQRFRRSLNMLSVNSFQELYSQNCLEQMEKINNLEMIIRDNEFKLNELLSLLREQQQKETKQNSQRKRQQPQSIIKCQKCRRFKFRNNISFINNKSSSKLNDVD